MFMWFWTLSSLGAPVIPNKGLESLGGQTSCIMGDVQMVNQKVP